MTIPVVKTSKKSGTTSLNWTENQKIVFDEIRSISNENSIDILFYMAYEFAKKQPLDYKAYSNFIGLLTEKSKDTYKLSYKKNVSFFEFKAITADLKSKWLNIPMKGVVLMYLLHYAKFKLGIDINKYL